MTIQCNVIKYYSKYLTLTALFFFYSCVTQAQKELPVEVYGLDPIVSDMKLSPNGELIAYTKYTEGKRVIFVVSLSGGGIVTAFDATKDKLRGYQFWGEKYLVINKSITTRFAGYRGEYEYYVSFATNLETGETEQLLRGDNRLFWPQLNLTDIVAAAEEGNVVMSARFGEFADVAYYELQQIDLETGRRVETIAKGTKDTIDWFIGKNEVVYAREEYSNSKNMHQILVEREGEWIALFEQETEIRNRVFDGLSPDEKALFFIDTDPSGEFEAGYHMSLQDGSSSAPVFFKQGAEIDSVLKNKNGAVYGVKYSGLTPSYNFYDADLDDDIDKQVRGLPGNSVHIVSVSDDFLKMLILIDGAGTSGSYYLLDRAKEGLRFLADMRPNIPDESVAAVVAFNVEARDGLNIPTLLTVPAGIEIPKKLPAIMMPHGGPASYDQVDFDYWAQFFANRGYLVIQPNFRGSTGFGQSHRLAGDGKWGQEMQTDLSDALDYLVKRGAVDPERVCIVGGSYGGYAALAGGAFTPDLYKCVVALAPVSDLPVMLNDEKAQYGNDHWVVAYWNRVIGDRKEDRDKLKAVSPARHADKFQAPVLLLHGDDDTTVPMRQSKLMRTALKRAKKSVELVTLKDEDHYLSNQKTRLQALKAMGEFVDENLK